MSLNNYSVQIKEPLSGIEQEIMLDLYQPIIGATAIGVYSTLVREEKILKKLNNIKFSENRLYKICGLTEKQFNDALSKLEGTCLVKISINKASQTKRFTLLAPLDIEQFFLNEMYFNTLKAKIGNENLEAIKFLWKEHIDANEDGYEEVTTSFIEVFSDEISANEIDFSGKTHFLQFLSKNKSLFSKIINVKEFKTQLAKIGINLDLNDKKVISQMNSILMVKNLASHELATIIEKTFNQETLVINDDKLQIEIEILINDVITNANKDLDPMLVSKATEFELFEPESFIYDSLNREANKNEKHFISELLDQGFKKGAINALIEYSEYKNDDKIVINYLVKISKSLYEKQLFTTSQVMMYLKDAKAATNTKELKFKLESNRKKQISIIEETKTNQFDSQHELTNEEVMIAINNM